MLESREVVNVDIAYDELPEKHYTPEEVRGDGAYYNKLAIDSPPFSFQVYDTLQTQPLFTCKTDYVKYRHNFPHFTSSC